MNPNQPAEVNSVPRKHLSLSGQTEYKISFFSAAFTALILLPAYSYWLGCYINKTFQPNMGFWIIPHQIFTLAAAPIVAGCTFVVSFLLLGMGRCKVDLPAFSLLILVLFANCLVDLVWTGVLNNIFALGAVSGTLFVIVPTSAGVTIATACSSYLLWKSPRLTHPTSDVSAADV